MALFFTPEKKVCILVSTLFYLGGVFGVFLQKSSFLWVEFLFIVYSFFLGETSSNKSCFIFFYAIVFSMLDLVDPSRSYDRLPFWSWDNIPNIVLHDRLIFFDHSILPFFLLCHFFITGRFFVNEIT